MITTTDELVTRAQTAADMHDATINPAQWNPWLTLENIALAVLLARAGWTLNMKTQAIAVTGAEAGQYVLATQPLAVVAVHQVRGNRVRLIDYTNVVDYSRMTATDTAATGDPSEYRVLWDQDNDRLVVNFYPTPAAGTQFIVSYIPHPLKLTLDDPVSDPTQYANSVRYPLGWEERIVLGLGKRALRKEESDTSGIQQDLDDLDKEIERTVYDQIFAAHSAVRNVDDEVRGWGTKMFYPPPARWFFY